MSIVVEARSGADIQPLLPSLAAMRIEVFRAFPYLYEGSADYEQRYLTRFAEAEGAVVVTASDDDEIVGCATATPLIHEHDEFIQPIRDHGFAPERIFYLAESVLRASYRGQGIGHRFFELREAHGRKLGGFEHFTFCGVVRPVDHTARPADFSPLDPFWRKRGYAPVPGLTTTFSWKEIGASKETAKPMQFWMKPAG